MIVSEIESLEKTRDMWEWLRDNPDKLKHEYLDSIGLHKYPMGKCYLCDLVRPQYSGSEECNKYPPYLSYGFIMV